MEKNSQADKGSRSGRTPLRSMAYLAEVIGIALAVVALWMSAADQKKSRHYQAWQAITMSQGKPGSGGRIDALQDLNADDVSLAGVNLTGDSTMGAYLSGIELPNANLDTANLQGAQLDEANLRQAYLAFANLRSAFLWRVDLREANLWEADLRDAKLVHADLRGALLLDADLRGAVLAADFRDASLEGAKLDGADLAASEWDRAMLEWVDPPDSDISLIGAKLSTTYAFTLEQLLSTKDWRGAILPEELKYMELPYDAPEEEVERLRAEYGAGVADSSGGMP